MKQLLKSTKLSGIVTSGDKIGRIIGFPTANLDIDASDLKIKPGVYASLVKYEETTYIGLAYFGPRYIQKILKNSFEVYILNFDQNIYGKKLEVSLTHFIRSPKKITNLKTLKTTLQKDLSSLDNYAVLINKQDQITGIKEILATHQNPPQRHQAISVFIFNSKKQLMLQKRSTHKPLWPLYWSNTCCSNKRPQGTMKQFAQKRLFEEMGLKASLNFKYKLAYKAKYDKTLSENEITHVFFGLTDKVPTLNHKEAADYRYISLANLKKDIKTNPQKYTPWFKLIMKRTTPSDILTS